MFLDPLLEIIWVDTDIPNWFAMVIELVIGLSIAGWFFKRQNDQQKKIDIIITTQDDLRKSKLKICLIDIIARMTTVERRFDAYLYEVSLNKNINENELDVNYFEFERIIKELEDIYKNNFEILPLPVIGPLEMILKVGNFRKTFPDNYKNLLQQYQAAFDHSVVDLIKKIRKDLKKMKYEIDENANIDNAIKKIESKKYRRFSNLQ